VGRLGNAGLSAGIECRIGVALDAPVLRLAGVRHYRKRTIVRFEDVATIEAAEKFLGKDLCIRRSAVPLSEGEYLDADLIGLEVRDLDGIPRGRVLRVEHYPAQDCLVLTPGDKLVPLVHAFIRAIDVNAGVIIIDPPPGLLDETGAEIA
jgi:16S rRNA processing protein RimM